MVSKTRKKSYIKHKKYSKKHFKSHKKLKKNKKKYSKKCNKLRGGSRLTVLNPASLTTPHYSTNIPLKNPSITLARSLPYSPPMPLSSPPPPLGMTSGPAYGLKIPAPPLLGGAPPETLPSQPRPTPSLPKPPPPTSPPPKPRRGEFDRRIGKPPLVDSAKARHILEKKEERAVLGNM